MQRRVLLAAAIVLLVLGGYAGYGSSASVDVPNPHTSGGDLSPDEMFSALRALGLRVSVDFSDWSPGTISCETGLMIDHMSPATGTPVQPGTAVTIVPELMGYGSPVGNPFKKLKRYRAPNFIGRPASAGLDWADHHDVCWSITHMPRLVASSAHDLYSAYRVTAQRPSPGSVVT